MPALFAAQNNPDTMPSATIPGIPAKLANTLNMFNFISQLHILLAQQQQLCTRCLQLSMPSQPILLSVCSQTAIMEVALMLPPVLVPLVLAHHQTAG